MFVAIVVVLIPEKKLEADIEVVGHTPCKSDSDCPDGETCTLAIETCG